jgi:hypothetical protein
LLLLLGVMLPPGAGPEVGVGGLRKMFDVVALGLVGVGGRLC